MSTSAAVSARMSSAASATVRAAVAVPNGVDHHVRSVASRRAMRAGRDLGTPPPGSPVDLALGGKLVRRAFLAEVAPPYESAERQAVTAATLAAAARAVAVVDEVVLVEHDRDVALPIHEQRRFRTDLVTAHVDALRHVLLDVLEPDDRHGWREQALVHLLPALCRDARRLRLMEHHFGNEDRPAVTRCAPRQRVTTVRVVPASRRIGLVMKRRNCLDRRKARKRDAARTNAKMPP